MRVPMYSGDVPAVIAFRVHREGAHAKVRVFIGQEGSPGLCGVLTMRPDDFHLFLDALMPFKEDGPRISVHFEGGAHEWLYPIAELTEEVA